MNGHDLLDLLQFICTKEPLIVKYSKIKTIYQRSKTMPMESLQKKNETQKYYELFIKSYSLQKELKEIEDQETNFYYCNKSVELANCYTELGEMENAIVLYKNYLDSLDAEYSVIEDNSNIVKVMYSLICCLLRREDYTEARKYIEKFHQFYLHMECPHKERVRGLCFYLKAKYVIESRDDRYSDILSLIDIAEQIYEEDKDYFPIQYFDLFLTEIRGDWYSYNEQYSKAIKCYWDTLSLAGHYGLEYVEAETYKAISKNQECLGQYKGAVESYLNYSRIAEMSYQARDYAYSNYLMSIYELDSKEVQMNELKEANDTLYKKANTDELTNIYNRRFLRELVERKCREGAFYDNEDSVIMIDIDCFKQYNDNYGHMEGDIVLQRIGNVLKSYERLDEYYPIRYGGEEFILYLDGVGRQESISMARRLVEEIYNLQIPHVNSKVSNVITVSAGV